MSSLFHNLLQVADVTLDQVFGANHTLVPMRERRNSTPVADTSRETIASFAGVFSDAQTNLSAPIAGSSPMFRTEAPPSVLVHRDELAWMPRRLDRVIRHRTGKTYEVREVRPDGHGRLVLELFEL